MKDTIEEFKQELTRRARERDENAYVTVHQTMEGQFTGELLAVFHLSSGKEYYAFNPNTKQWMVVYNL